MIMDMSNTDSMAKVNILKAALDKIEALVIGTGDDLSVAVGLAYDNADTFNALFHGCHDRYGLKTISEADFYQFPAPEEQYAYWPKYIAVIRYDFLPGKPYNDLCRIIKVKNHVIITANTDWQFFDSGLDTGKICFPQLDLPFSNDQSPKIKS
jgi:hypothetical protein